MGVTGSIVVFVVIWWLIFFMSLPFGVRGQWEDNQVEEGTEPGAPQTHGLGKKALATTGIAIVLWALVWAAVYFDIFHFTEGLSWDTAP
jgi:predicted secreted protein